MLLDFVGWSKDLSIKDWFSPLFTVCLETLGSEESSFYLLPEGIPQAISHWTNIMVMMIKTGTMMITMMIKTVIMTMQEGPPSILANSSAKSIHVSTGETWTIFLRHEHQIIAFKFFWPATQQNFKSTHKGGCYPPITTVSVITGGRALLHQN